MGLPPTQGHSNLRLPNTSNMYYNHRLDNIIQQHNSYNYCYYQRHNPNNNYHDLLHTNQLYNGDVYPYYLKYRYYNQMDDNRSLHLYDECSDPILRHSSPISLICQRPCLDSNSLSDDVDLCSRNWCEKERITAQNYLCICRNFRYALCFENILTRHIKRVRFNRNILSKMSMRANGLCRGFLSNKSD